MSKATTASSLKTLDDLLNDLAREFPEGMTMPQAWGCPVFLVQSRNGVAMPLGEVCFRRKSDEAPDVGAALRALPNGTLYVELSGPPL